MSARAAAVAVGCAVVALLAGCAAGSSPAADGRSEGPQGSTISTTARPNSPVPPISTPSTYSPASSVTVARPVAATPPSDPATTPPGLSDATACAKNRAGQLVRVSLRRQHLWMCAKARLAYSTPITSGIVGQYSSTPTGTYTVQALDRNSVLTLNTGQQYTVKYWIPFDGPLFGFHDSSWQDFPYGSAKYKTRGSHGCVHMPLTAIKFLYNWAEVGARVTIRA